MGEMQVERALNQPGNNSVIPYTPTLILTLTLIPYPNPNPNPNPLS